MDNNKRLKNPKKQSRMDNPEKLAKPGTQNTGRRQTKHKNTTEKTKKPSVYMYTVL